MRSSPTSCEYCLYENLRGGLSGPLPHFSAGGPLSLFIVSMLVLGRAFFPGKGRCGEGAVRATLWDSEWNYFKSSLFAVSALLATSSVETEGVHLWSCPGSRPSPTPSPALYFLLMKYAWRTDVPAPPLPAPLRASPRPQLPRGSQIPLPMTAWPGCLILMRGLLGPANGELGVCVYLHIYAHKAGPVQVCVCVCECV